MDAERNTNHLNGLEKVRHNAKTSAVLLGEHSKPIRGTKHLKTTKKILQNIIQ